MEYSIEINTDLDKKFLKLQKQNVKQLRIIRHKLSEIQMNPHHYKILKGSMKGIRRVHIDKHFVLTFKILEEEKIIQVLDYEHHDKIYK